MCPTQSARVACLLTYMLVYVLTGNRVRQQIINIIVGTQCRARCFLYDPAAGSEGWQRGGDVESEENEMCVKLYSERRAVDDRDGRTDTQLNEARWNEGENKRMEQKVVRECAPI